MKFFNAVGGNSRYMRICLKLAERQNGHVLCPLLFSFAYRNSFTDLWSYLSKRDLILDHLILDSGAPTVWSKGLYVDLDEYAQVIRWIQDNPLVRQATAVSLDVIPRDRSETEECAEASLRNFLYFKKLGIDSISVYHFGENRKWLDKMLEHTNYIGLGGMQRGSHEEWLDGTWEYLIRQNIKGLKVHGFAQTSLPVMQRYDWFSVDSTSALMAAAMGRVYLPRFSSDGYDYRRRFSVSAGEKLPTHWRDHAEFLKGSVKEEIATYLDTIGFHYDDLFDHYKRIAINVRFFMNCMQTVNLV